MTSDIPVHRRRLIRAVAAGALTALTPTGLGMASAASPNAGTKLVILGSMAGPSVGAARYQTSHAVLVGDRTYVVDCGYGATEQLVRAGIKLASIRDIYVTHHHPDHNIELGTLIYFAWYAGLETPLGIYGPPPIRAITEAYLKAEKPDMDVWLKDIGHKPLGPIHVHEISAGGPVCRSGRPGRGPRADGAPRRRSH